MSGRLLGRLAVGVFAAFAVALVVSSRLAPPLDPAEGGVAGPESPSGRTTTEEEAVSAALDSGLRPAKDEDAAESEAREELRTLYGEYRPYFVRGDFDADGRLDFAQAFVRRDGPEPLFDVAVFFGSAEGFTPPVWVDRGLTLSAGDLSVDRSVLVVTDDVEEEVSRRWRWDPARRRFVDVDAGRGEDDGEPWVEPDGRLGTTA